MKLRKLSPHCSPQVTTPSCDDDDDDHDDNDDDGDDDDDDDDDVDDDDYDDDTKVNLSSGLKDETQNLIYSLINYFGLKYKP